MSSVAIVYREQTPQAYRLAQDLAEWLKEHELKVYTAPDQKLIRGTKLIPSEVGAHSGAKKSAKTTKKKLSSASAIWDKVQLVVVIGGDGTYLRAVRLLNGRRIPVLGINAGSLGFLTSIRVEDLYQAVEKALQEQMHVRSRTMIHYKLKSKGKIIYDGLALNDVVLERGSMSHLLNIEMYSEKFLVSEIKSDGLIVSTPTGSTAYNLAAGGPILHPQCKAFVVTPVAAHSLTSRPFLFPDDRVMSFRLHKKCQLAALVVDGFKVAELAPTDELIIEKSSQEHLMVRDPAHNHFELLREKLKFGDTSSR